MCWYSATGRADVSATVHSVHIGTAQRTPRAWTHNGSVANTRASAVGGDDAARVVMRRADGGPIHVLVVDDEPVLAELVSMALRYEGWDIATEFELLRFMMRNAKRVLSKAQILDRVWSYDFGGRSNIVELYVSYLRKKIDSGREPMIHTLRGAGYVLKPAR